MPYRCKDCRKYFSVKTGTALACSNLPLQTLGIRDLPVSDQPQERFEHEAAPGFGRHPEDRMVHGCSASARPFTARVARFAGPVEVDETYIGGLERNKHESKKLRAGRGPVGKVAVVGMKDRATKRVAAKVVEHTDKETLQGFVDAHAAPGATAYTDGTSPYRGMDRPHESVKHSVGEYVRGMARTNGVESFWSMLKRAHKGTFHKLSAKHLQRYVNEFAAKQNLRDFDTADQMQHVVAGLVGRRLLYRELVA